MFNQMYFILKGLYDTNSKKCIVFCKSVELCEIYKTCAMLLDKKLNYNIKLFEITYETKKNNRKKIIEHFTNGEENINIIFSIHVLDEGVDIASCDSIFITNLNDNPLNLIQRISRCNRIDNNNENKMANVFIWTDKYDKLNSMLDKKFVVVKQKSMKYKEIIVQKKTISNSLDIKWNQFKKKYDDNNEYEFKIELEKICDLLNMSKKDNLMRTIKKEFVINEDYEKYKFTKLSNITKSNNFHAVKLNYNSFKKLIILSNNKKCEIY